MTAGHGSLKKTGHDSYSCTFVAFIGSPTGAYTGWIKVVGTVDMGRVGWSGPFRVTVFDPNSVTIFADNGTFSGKEIRVEKY